MKGLNLGSPLISSLDGMKRVRMDIPEILGTWTGPSTTFNYVVPALNKIILIHNKDREALLKEHGQNKLPII